MLFVPLTADELSAKAVTAVFDLTILTPATLITVPSAYTAVNGDQLFVNTSATGINTAVTITLPASPAVGDEVTIIDSGNFAASNNITIGRNSSNINGSAGDLVINTNSAAFTLVYANTARGWVYKTTKIS